MDQKKSEINKTNDHHNLSSYANNTNCFAFSIKNDIFIFLVV